MPKIHPQMTSPQKVLGIKVQANQIMYHQVSTIPIHVTSIDITKASFMEHNYWVKILSFYIGGGNGATQHASQPAPAGNAKN